VKVSHLPENAHLKWNQEQSCIKSNVHRVSLTDFKLQKKIWSLTFESQRCRYLKFIATEFLGVNRIIMHNFQFFVLNDNRIFHGKHLVWTVLSFKQIVFKLWSPMANTTEFLVNYEKSKCMIRITLKPCCINL